jgi:decaprenylphospho-beta-D-ribofuranose 2-oxidase
MDTNVRAASLYRRLGGEVYFAQQTFVIPGSPATVSASSARAGGFMREAARRLAACGFAPALFDVLYLPPDAGRDEGGLAVTAAFVILDRARVDPLADCLVELATLCRSLGGRVHLVKDVHARAEDLAAMHAGRIEQLFAVRARLDPQGVMRNDFLDRVLIPARNACGAGGERARASRRELDSAAA